MRDGSRFILSMPQGGLYLHIGKLRIGIESETLFCMSIYSSLLYVSFHHYSLFLQVSVSRDRAHSSVEIGLLGICIHQSRSFLQVCIHGCRSLLPAFMDVDLLCQHSSAYICILLHSWMYISFAAFDS